LSSVVIENGDDLARRGGKTKENNEKGRFRGKAGGLLGLVGNGQKTSPKMVAKRCRN